MGNILKIIYFEMQLIMMRKLGTVKGQIDMIMIIQIIGFQ